MTDERPLAEIVAEGRALEAAGKAQPQLSDQLAFSEVLTLFYAVHGPRLLAVAEAALKIRKTLDVLEYAGTSPRLSADIAAFDALAARGGE